MKRKDWIILSVVLLAFVLFIGCIVSAFAPMFAVPESLRKSQIKTMADYLNEKYGFSVTRADCIYSRKEDYTYHDAFLYGTTYDVPNIAIFDYQGKQIVVTERNGFLGDDAQLEELNGLLSDYFSEETGLDIAFVEVRTSHNGNVKDALLNELLHHSFNEKLTTENVGRFVDLLWAVDSLELIFYYKPGISIDSQIREITAALLPLRAHSNLESLRFYILADSEMNVHYTQPRALWQGADRNSREADENYIWGHYHVVNEVEHHYPAWESNVYHDVAFNHFLAGGYCILDRGYSGGFGNREVEKVNNFGVVDLGDAKLDEYLQEMVSYGQHRGYTILFRAGEQSGYSKYIIPDGDKYSWEFRWGSGPIELYAFKHGRLVDLKTAYDCAYLSLADMERILQAHKAHFLENHKWNYEIEPGELSDEVRAQIIDCFPEWFGSHNTGENDDADTIGPIQYYGTFGDYAILMTAGACYAISEEEIGGLMFRWGTYPLNFYAYRDGHYRTLQEAYEAGDISDADLEAILQRHKEYFATVHNWDHDAE